MADKMTLEQAAALCVRVGTLFRHGSPIKDKLLTGNLLMQAAMCIAREIKKQEANS
jgi:hypothetical protein